jgi:hypothetical protein
LIVACPITVSPGTEPLVQHHAGIAIDDPSAVVGIAATGPTPEAVEAAPDVGTPEAPTPDGSSAAGPDGSREDPVCPRAVEAAAMSKTAQAITVMTTRRREIVPDGLIGLSFRDDDYVSVRRIADPRAFPLPSIPVAFPSTG